MIQDHHEKNSTCHTKQLSFGRRILDGSQVVPNYKMTFQLERSDACMPRILN